MKYRTTRISALLMAAAITVSAADSWYSNLSLAPVGALKTENIDGPSQWGAGLDIGYKVNDFVSLHAVNLSFEGTGQTITKTKKGLSTSGEDEWGGLLVDETAFILKADITKFKYNSFIPYFIGGGFRDWNNEDWGFSAGIGAELRLGKRVSLGGDYSLRAKFNQNKDSLARGFLNVSF